MEITKIKKFFKRWWSDKLEYNRKDLVVYLAIILAFSIFHIFSNSSEEWYVLFNHLILICALWIILKPQTGNYIGLVKIKHKKFIKR